MENINLNNELKTTANFLRLSILPLFFLFVTSVFSQNCKASLEVEKNRSFKAVSEKGSIFRLVITNTGGSSETYTMSSNSLNTPCDNGIQKKIRDNVSLNVSVMSKSKTALKDNKIALAAGEKKLFLIKITAPAGTPSNSWGCVQINATADKCKTSVANTVLSAYVVDPSEK